MKKTVTIIDPIGIHARPAAAIVKETSKYQEQINIIFKETQTDAKSILGLMSLGVKVNDEITIEVTGENEEVMNNLLSSLKENKLI